MCVYPCLAIKRSCVVIFILVKCQKSKSRRQQLLEKVIGRSAGNVRLAALGCRVKLQKGVVEGVIEFHYGRLVATAVAVVGRRKDGHDIVVVAPVEALHYELMGAGDERQAVRVVKGLANVVAKGVAGATGTDAPAAAVVRV